MMALLHLAGPPPRVPGLRRLACRATVRICLLLAGLILRTARGLYRAGVVGPLTVHRALTWSSGLTQLGLRAWRGEARYHRSRSPSQR